MSWSFFACVFFVDIFWYIWHQDLHSTLNKLAEEKVMGVMSGDAGGGCPFHSQGQLCILRQTALKLLDHDLNKCEVGVIHYVLCGKGSMDHVQGCVHVNTVFLAPSRRIPQ